MRTNLRRLLSSPQKCLLVSVLLPACAENLEGSASNTESPTKEDNDTSDPEGPDEGSSADPTESSTGEEMNEESNTEENEADDAIFCCGCLCVDDHWSCSDDTCLNRSGQVVNLGPEAGFIEIEGSEWSFDSVTFSSPNERVWYTFQPAMDSPETKPLMMFFNGGPGSATMPILFALNTAPFTIDPTKTGEQDYATNPLPWTEYANLVYVDAPRTGFSYSTKVDSEPNDFSDDSKNWFFDADRDASIFVQVLLHFLNTHPQLSNEIILVGESYGGFRAQLMLDQLFNSEKLLNRSSYYDPQLYSRIQERFELNFGPPPYSKDRISTRFGKQVLIQPLISWNQLFPPPPRPHSSEHCLPIYDPYQCNEPRWYSDELRGIVAHRLLDPDLLATILAIDLSSIEWLHASSRQHELPRQIHSYELDESDFEIEFGDLSEGNHYFISNFHLRFNPLGRPERDPNSWQRFLENTYYGNVLITRARFDEVIHSWQIPVRLSNQSEILESVEENYEDSNSLKRPGEIVLHYREGYEGNPATERRIRFPGYAEAGHAVTHRQAPELLEDIRDFFEN